MKIKKPEPFTFEAGPRAVLLLHGFTGHSADVRMLGRYLESKGYTSHAPIYSGHGVEPEKLIETSPADWWEDVEEAYEYLKFLGYDEIAVAGLSIGGVLGLNLASKKQVKGIVTMCTPMFFDNEQQLTQGFRHFAEQYKQLENLAPDEIENEVEKLMAQSELLFEKIGKFVEMVNGAVNEVYSPALIIQAVKDEMINPEGANFIYEHIASDQKDLKWFENSGHFITVDKEKQQLHEDIYMFLESLDWEQ